MHRSRADADTRRRVRVRTARRWGDAVLQLVTFNSALEDPDVARDPFNRHVVRLFTQLSVLATLRLHIDLTQGTTFDSASGWLKTDIFCLLYTSPSPRDS